MIFSGKTLPLQELNPLVSRRVLPHTDSLMMVEVHFKKGGIGEAHSHAEHEQVSYILKGSFEVSVGEKTSIVHAGDGFCVDKNIVHGVVALEDSVILDVFTPLRKDFL